MSRSSSATRSKGSVVAGNGVLLVVEDEDLESAPGMMTRDGIGEDPCVREVVARNDGERAEEGGRR